MNFSESSLAVALFCPRKFLCRPKTDPKSGNLIKGLIKLREYNFVERVQENKLATLTSAF